ncbi:MAG TPA: hypothetical protein VIM14_02840, partial [Polyangia bacterium]
MKRNSWKYARVVLVAVGLVGALVSCNSHALVEAKDPGVVVIDPPDVRPPYKPPVDDAGLPSGNPFPIDDLPDGETPDDPQPVPPPDPDAGPVPPGPD